MLFRSLLSAPNTRSMRTAVLKVLAMVMTHCTTTAHGNNIAYNEASKCATVQDELLMSGDLLPDSLKFSTSDAPGCCAACRNHTGCDAWSWGGPASWLPLRCYLKELSRTRRGAGKAKDFVTGSTTDKPLPPRPSLPPSPPVQPLPFDTEVTVDATPTAHAKPFEHYWKKAFGSGHARLTLRKDWQDHLKQATEQLGLTGVRHHG